MAIEYIEVRDAERRIIGIIDDMQSLIWHRVYFGVGDFEIYASMKYAEYLAEGNYLTRKDDDEVGIIESAHITYDSQNGRMIRASGRFAKSILDRRHIFRLTGNINRPTYLSGNVEKAVCKVTENNIIHCSFDPGRNIRYIRLAPLSGLTEVIVDETGRPAQKQVSYGNLLTYTDEVLQEYGLSSKMVIFPNPEENQMIYYLQYKIYKGIDRSIDNTDGNESVIFSQEFDNLTSSEYLVDTSGEKNAALIGGEGEGIERYYSIITGSQTGDKRRETWVDASSINREMKEDELQSTFPGGSVEGIYYVVDGTIYATLVSDLSQEYSIRTLEDMFPTGVIAGIHFKVGNENYANLIYGETENYHLTEIGYKKMLEVREQVSNYRLSDAVYKSLLDAQGLQELADHKKTESFTGSIDVTNSQWKLNEDFFLGDIVSVIDNDVGIYKNVRITEVTEVQDENGYIIDAVYE